MLHLDFERALPKVKKASIFTERYIPRIESASINPLQRFLTASNAALVDLL